MISPISLCLFFFIIIFHAIVTVNTASTSDSNPKIASATCIKYDNAEELVTLLNADTSKYRGIIENCRDSIKIFSLSSPEGLKELIEKLLKDDNLLKDLDKFRSVYYFLHIHPDLVPIVIGELENYAKEIDLTSSSSPSVQECKKVTLWNLNVVTYENEKYDKLLHHIEAIVSAHELKEEQLEELLKILPKYSERSISELGEEFQINETSKGESSSSPSSDESPSGSSYITEDMPAIQVKTLYCLKYQCTFYEMLKTPPLIDIVEMQIRKSIPSKVKTSDFFPFH